MSFLDLLDKVYQEILGCELVTKHVVTSESKDVFEKLLNSVQPGSLKLTCEQNLEALALASEAKKNYKILYDKYLIEFPSRSLLINGRVITKWFKIDELIHLNWNSDLCAYIITTSTINEISNDYVKSLENNYNKLWNTKLVKDKIVTEESMKEFEDILNEVQPCNFNDPQAHIVYSEFKRVYDKIKNDIVWKKYSQILSSRVLLSEGVAIVKHFKIRNLVFLSWNPKEKKYNVIRASDHFNIDELNRIISIETTKNFRFNRFKRNKFSKEMKY